jgi:hypothetical protein
MVMRSRVWISYYLKSASRYGPKKALGIRRGFFLAE